MTPALRTEGIAKAFGGVQALSGCTIEVAQGSITGLIGPNGSGKTTLFNIITGYEKPDGGEVYLGGRRITGESPQRVFAAGIGRTFQLTRIFPRLTVLENMIIAPAQQYMSTAFNNSYLAQILLGALFLAVILFVPRGLIPTIAEKGGGWLERRRSGPGVPAAERPVPAGEAS